MLDAYRPRIVFKRARLGARQGLISVIAAFAAYMPAHLLGLPQSFWGSITAIAVAQAKFQDTESAARKQFTGAAIGGAVALGLILGFGDNLGIYAAAVLLSIIVCWLLDVADASQLAGVTATIILLVPHTGSPERMLAARLSEVTLGVCVGLFIVWLEERLLPDRP